MANARAQRVNLSYSPAVITLDLDTAAEELAFRDFLNGLSSQFVEAVLQATNSETATPERVRMVWEMFNSVRVQMAPLGVPGENS